jgi:hypothetical protein
VAQVTDAADGTAPEADDPRPWMGVPDWMTVGQLRNVEVDDAIIGDLLREEAERRGEEPPTAAEVEAAKRWVKTKIAKHLDEVVVNVGAHAMTQSSDFMKSMRSTSELIASMKAATAALTAPALKMLTHTPPLALDPTPSLPSFNVADLPEMRQLRETRSLREAVDRQTDILRMQVDALGQWSRSPIRGRPRSCSTCRPPWRRVTVIRKGLVNGACAGASSVPSLRLRRRSPPP